MFLLKFRFKNIEKKYLNQSFTSTSKNSCNLVSLYFCSKSFTKVSRKSFAQKNQKLYKVLFSFLLYKIAYKELKIFFCYEDK